MNITKIGFNTYTKFNENRNTDSKINVLPHFGLKMSPVLKQDTVSFTSTKGKKIQKVISKEVAAAIARKKARMLRDERLIAEAEMKADAQAQTKKQLDGEERKRGISYDTAKKIKATLTEPQERIHDFMHKFFDEFVVSSLNPKNLLQLVDDRAKSAVSIMEKSATRDWNTKQEVYAKMTDLNGAKLVLAPKTGKQDAETVLSTLIPLIKNETIILKEIELQRPGSIKNLSEDKREKYDYVSKAFLDRLEDVQEAVINKLNNKVEEIELIDRPLPKYTNGNYCALHLLLQFPEKGSRPFELQIMGPRVATGKYVDDSKLKFFFGKELDKKYSRLVKLWEPLKSEENADARERYLQYAKDANLELREREIREYETQRIINRGNRLFISVHGYCLPPEYDLDNIYQIKKECDRLAKIASQNLEEARKAKSAKPKEQKQES